MVRIRTYLERFIEVYFLTVFSFIYKEGLDRPFFFSYISSMIEKRPWGTYEVLLDKDNCKVKEIVVNPGQRLSYQYHHKRREQWTVVEGTLTIVLDDEKVFREPGESIHIPLGACHRAWNETDKHVKFIEVQTGTYFGEDDIVRLEDDYER